MTKDEIIEELRLEMNPGSKTVDDMLGMIADLIIEKEHLNQQIQEKEEQKQCWYSKYCEELNKNIQMKECLFSIGGIVKVIVERWK